MSLLSAGCIFWLQTLQPLFAAIAAAAVGYQAWLVFRRPPALRTRRALVIFWSSVGVCALVAITWILLWLRYR